MKSPQDGAAHGGDGAWEEKEQELGDSTHPRAELVDERHSTANVKKNKYIHKYISQGEFLDITRVIGIIRYIIWSILSTG